MSGHAKVTEEERKLIRHLFDTYVLGCDAGNIDGPAQLLSDAIRDARLKEAEGIRDLYLYADPGGLDWVDFKLTLDQRIEAIKRGEA